MIRDEGFGAKVWHCGDSTNLLPQLEGLGIGAEYVPTVTGGVRGPHRDESPHLGPSDHLGDDAIESTCVETYSRPQLAVA